jgi:hypothetical protein
MGNMATNDQYLLNPIYETEITQDAAKKPVMMSLARHRPMMGPPIFLPARNRGGAELHWFTAYGQQISGSKPQGAQRADMMSNILYTELIIAPDSLLVICGKIAYYKRFLQNSVSFAEALAVFRDSSFKTEVLKEVHNIRIRRNP